MSTIAINPSNTYTLQIPESDRTFFNALVKKMGWTVKRTATTSFPMETLAAIEEARSGIDAGGVDTSSLESFVLSMTSRGTWNVNI